MGAICSSAVISRTFFQTAAEIPDQFHNSDISRQSRCPWQLHDTLTGRLSASRKTVLIPRLPAATWQNSSSSDIPNSPSHSRTVWVSALSPHPGLVKYIVSGLLKFSLKDLRPFKHQAPSYRKQCAYRRFCLMDRAFSVFQQRASFMDPRGFNLTIGIRESQPI